MPRPFCQGHFSHFDPDLNQTLCFVICPDMMRNETERKWYLPYRDFSFWVNGIINLLLVLMGLMGIIPVLLSTRNNPGKYRLMWHVRLLCLWDALALFSMFGLAVVPSLRFKTSQIYGPSIYFIRVFLPLSNMANFASMWQIIAIAAERYLAVVDPLRSYTRGKKSLKIICTLIAAGALLMYSPIVFGSKTGYCYDNAQERIFPFLTRREFSKKPLYKWIVQRIPSFLLRSPTPFALLIFLTAGTLEARRRSVRQSLNSRRHGTKRRGAGTAFTLTIIKIKFIVLQSLPVVYDILSIFNILNLRDQYYMADVSNLLITLQSATNWLVFLKWNQVAGQYDNIKRVQVEFTETEIECIRKMYEPNACDKQVNGDLPLIGNSDQMLDLVFKTLAAESISCVDVRDQLRDFGMGIDDRLDAQSWLHAKKTIVESLVGQQTRSPHERFLAAKFGSFVIREIKHGMVCQRAGESRKNTSSVV